MTDYDHLPLVQTGTPTDRRRRPDPSGPPKRKYKQHAKKLTTDVDSLIAQFRTSVAPDAVDPGLVCKVTVDGSIDDDEWAKINLRLLAHADQHSVILFADDSQLTAFRERLSAYGGEKPEGQKGQPYQGFINHIVKLGPLAPVDRIGPGLVSDGFDASESFVDDETYLLDVEIWRPDDDFVEVFLDRVMTRFEEHGGEELSRYHPPMGIMVRVRGPGSAFKDLLTCIEVAQIDLPPRPDLEDGGVPKDTLDDLGPIHPVASDAVCIGIIDSGVNDGHPLLEHVVSGAFGVGGQPAGDDHGHGTAVAAVAAYGDLDTMRQLGEFKPRFAIASARVVDARGRFADMDMAPQLVEEAIRTLRTDHNCRVINLSLANRQQRVGGRASLWASVLDTLARELDLVVVVTTGNTDRAALSEAHGNQIVEVYPSYLLEEANRLLEPGGAINALTIGSVAHVNGLSGEQADDVSKQSFVDRDEPSPFTRSGPGIGGALKPDLVDYGGNAIFDGTSQQLRNGGEHPAAGILSLYHQYADRLFATYSGTSFAAPLVAYKVALLMERFPDVPANMIRALLAVGAEYPEAGLERLDPDHDSKRHAVLGYGLSNVESSLFSADDRVILTHSSTLKPDEFAVFELPVPEAFQIESGRRDICVALCFDPLVRRSRKDYAGIRMNFELIRGATADEVVEAYRSLDKDEDTPDKLAERQKCIFSPRIKQRETSTLQCGTFTMQQNVSEYGDTYYVVVRCLGRWAAELVEAQPFSIAVQMRHEAQIQLYEKLRARLQVDAG